MPKGSISIGHSNNATKWFYSYDNTQVYLKKKDIQLAKRLAIKKYLYLKIKYLESKLELIQSSSCKLNQAEKQLEKFLSDSAYIALLEDFFNNNSSEAKQWMNSNYPRNLKHPENLIHSTIGGLKVRSKSESMIAIALSEHNIPFRYENLITINNNQFAPDFTLLQDGKIYYWEHFGLIENETYYNDCLFKIKQYSKANIILGDNLIVSFESKDNPLTYPTIENIINQYLL